MQQHSNVSAHLFRYVDEQATDLDDALARIQRHTQEGKAISIALHSNAAELLPELVKRNVRPDIVPDQTSAHDPMNGYLPIGWQWEDYRERAKTEPAVAIQAAKASMRSTSKPCSPSSNWALQPSITATIFVK